ncbi:hypothetical protein ARMGADRAFT_84276 [Armillaria gallica]|uniref:Uncharacterized protein n=1 Tax=Armillaria gallica TaxID=47427 RepID=A0A2H3CXZ8_ARMGA|nr:hypothetical protein ARMGADRAFT_84276 [Armillaria gallica]
MSTNNCLIFLGIRDLFGISTRKTAATRSIWLTALSSRTNRFLFAWLEDAADGQRLCGHQIAKETTSGRPFSVLTRWPSLMVVRALTVCGECWNFFGLRTMMNCALREPSCAVRWSTSFHSHILNPRIYPVFFDPR